MPSKHIVESQPITRYLAQCRVRHSVVEAEGVAKVPPTGAETQQLLAHLRSRGIEAIVVGSVGVLHHLSQSPTGSEFRPTVDLDLFVPVSQEQLRRTPLPPGWTVDRESLGVVSWISPGGGYVDFMTANHEFADGERTPRRMQRDPASTELPVAAPVELFRLKLATMRSRDLSDLHALALARGLPSDKELGPLTQTQSENLGLLKLWLKHARSR